MRIAELAASLAEYAVWMCTLMSVTRHASDVRPPENWSICDVCTWLNRLGDTASLYTTHFRTAHIDGRALFTLDDTSLTHTCHVMNAVARMRILYEVGKMRRERVAEMEMMLRPEEEEGIGE